MGGLFSSSYCSKVKVSDHNSLMVSSRKNDRLPFIDFKFDLSWLNNPEFFTLVENMWIKPCRTKSALDRIQQKLKLFEQFFKG